MKFNSLVPELYVSDFQKSIDFYVGLIGFVVEYSRNEPSFALLSLDEAQLMLEQQTQETGWHTAELEHPYGRGINFQIRVRDIKQLLEKLQKANYPIRRGITENWRKAGDVLAGSLEMHVLDPDGYFMRFSEKLGEKPLTAWSTSQP